jgi:hypothetical protein
MSIVRAMRTPAGIRRSLALWTVCALGAVGLAACGGSDSDPGSTTPSTSMQQQPCSNCGTAMVSLTDQPGDFVSYIVNVDSLTLTRSDGTVVQTVPVTTQVDFAQLVNLSEIVSADQIPAGNYMSAALTLDFTNATIVVDTSSGDVTVPAADILSGTTGQPLTGQLTLTLSLSSDQQLIITPGTVANLALDFNLLASNTVNLTANPLTVNPTLTASLTPDTTKQIHVRGPLVSVSTSANDYVINVRPFDDQSNTTGQVTIGTTDSTTYLINGTSYTGSAGLTQLATLAAGTLTSTYGSWDRTAGTLTATQVLVGPSVEGSTTSSVAGTVLARSGDTVTVGNGLLFQPESAGPGLTFQRQVSVTVGSGTTVTEEGQSGPFTASNISVGQNVRISGTAGTGSAGTPTLDATAGTAFLLPTSGLGLLTTTATGSVTVGLQQLGNVDASDLNFAGTGATSQQDATASSYQVSVPSSVSTSASSGTAVEFTGFVTPFGSAPPDFAASTLVVYGQTQTLFDARWASPGNTAPFATLNASELLLSQTTLQAAGAQNVLQVGWLSLSDTSLTGGLQLVPDTTGTAPQSFAIVHVQSHTIDSFSTFNDLATALATDLNGTVGVLQVMAEGSYSSGAITADHVIVALNN